LQLLLAKNVSATALVAHQRRASKSNAMSVGELGEAVEQLEENDRQYIIGYMQGPDRWAGNMKRPAPIAQEAEPATACRARQKAEAVKKGARGFRSRAVP
jgi:hypothetical protein